MGIDRNLLISALKEESTCQFPFVLHIYDTVSSTNSVLWELIDRGATEGTVVIAAQQTAGRGQRGHQWRSPLGGLYLSLALTPEIGAQNALLLTISSAWGIATTLRQLPSSSDPDQPRIPVQLKWPNDIILKERKLGGILTETRIQRGKITKAVVGVGINWENQVPEMGINLKSYLADDPRPPITSLEKLAAMTLQGIVWGYQQAQDRGMTSLLSSYQQLLTSMDRPVAVDGQKGIVTGISAQGLLRVRLTSSAPESEITIEPGKIRLGYDLPRS
ncbi:MAG: biotin--[acetyl-CoA-carboxylase] ligase [Hormoscilla sp.]